MENQTQPTNQNSQPTSINNVGDLTPFAFFFGLVSIAFAAFGLIKTYEIGYDSTDMENAKGIVWICLGLLFAMLAGVLMLISIYKHLSGSK